jgi:hypothetical protein
MRWVGNVAHTGERNAHKILVGKPEGRGRSRELSLDNKIILEWIFEKKIGKV